MPLPYPLSKLDGMQTLRAAFDEDTGSFRTDASFSGSISVNLDAATDSVSIKDPDTGNSLEINVDGSINANVAILHTEDSVRLGNGTDFITSTTVGLAKTLDVSVKEMPSGLAQETTLQSIDSKLNNLDIRDLVFATDKVDVTGSSISVDNFPSNQDVTITNASIVVDLPTNAATASNQISANALLTSIDTKLTSPLSVNAVLSDEPIKMSGTENGLPGGTEFTFVNTLRNQILAAKDRVQNITYADFGTKDERVTQIDYNSSSIGSGAGYTARQTFVYTLVSGKYRRDSISWTLV